MQGLECGGHGNVWRHLHAAMRVAGDSEFGRFWGLDDAHPAVNRLKVQDGWHLLARTVCSSVSK